MPTVALVTMVIGGLVVVGALIWFLYYRRMNQPLQTTPQTQPGAQPAAVSPSSETNENEEWGRLGVPLQVVRNLEAKTGSKFIPQRLEGMTQEMNRNLLNAGFGIVLNCHQMLEVLAAQVDFNKVGKTVEIVDTAIWLWLDRQIRNESNLSPGETIQPELLKQRLATLRAEAKKSRQEVASASFQQTQPSVATSSKPESTDSVADLIRRQAEFLVKKELGLKQTDPIPADKQDVLAAKMEEAREQCRAKGYEVPESE